MSDIIKLYEEDDFILSYEIHDGRMFIHMKMDKMGKTRYLELLHIWFDILEELNILGIKEVFASPICPKSRKFQEMFGFEFYSESDTGSTIMFLPTGV